MKDDEGFLGKAFESEEKAWDYFQKGYNMTKEDAKKTEWNYCRVEEVEVQ